MAVEMGRGKVIDFSPDGTITIQMQVDPTRYVAKGWQEAWVQLIDSRSISDKQRRQCWAIISEIADYIGDKAEDTNQDLKWEFIAKRAEQLGENLTAFFSLSNAPMDLVVEYQKYLIDFVVRNDIPTRFSLLQYVEESSITDYVYSCLIHKKCCICGKKAELHHCDRVGMGRNRETIIHEGLKVLPLCREHHSETENTPATEFFAKYHLDDGIPADKTICKIYRLKSQK